MDVQLGFGHAGYEVSDVHGELINETSTSTLMSRHRMPSICGFLGDTRKSFQALLILAGTFSFGQSAAMYESTQI
jgi:hypothetical protein